MLICHAACPPTPWVLAFASCCSPATSKYARHAKQVKLSRFRFFLLHGIIYWGQAPSDLAAILRKVLDTRVRRFRGLATNCWCTVWVVDVQPMPTISQKMAPASSVDATQFWRIHQMPLTCCRVLCPASVVSCAVANLRFQRERTPPRRLQEEILRAKKLPYASALSRTRAIARCCAPRTCHKSARQ
jgi:hypothetical protein